MIVIITLFSRINYPGFNIPLPADVCKMIAISAVNCIICVIDKSLCELDKT
jgi:hypothetical protein